MMSAMQDVIQQRECLNALDRALGDGDHGTTVARGASAPVAALNEANATDVNEPFALAW
jgi:dihydroxyacetone kinase-like protein